MNPKLKAKTLLEQMSKSEAITYAKNKASDMGGNRGLVKYWNDVVSEIKDIK